jgi:microcompartment protein CcmL/EutN
METPALAVLELDSIARGIVTADEVVKRAPVRLLAATPSTPGRFLVVFAGSVAEVEYAFSRGREIASDHLVDRLFLPFADEQVVAAIAEPRRPAAPDAIGVLELRTAATTILAADAAAKAAEVRLVQVVVSRGLHGKGFVTLSGSVSDVEAGVEAGRRLAETQAGAVGHVVIPNPDPALAERVYAGRWGELIGSALY